MKMTSLVQLIKTAGPKMVPFLKTVTIYFLLIHHSQDYRGQFWSTVLKCAPILSLMVFVFLYGVRFTKEYRYQQKILLGLLFSCVGDALLNWHLFPHGMVAFGIAQCWYIAAFGFRQLRLWMAAVFFVSGSVALSFIVPILDGVLLVGLPIYTMLLLTMTWRALSRIELKSSFDDIPKMACGIGGVLFLISDSVLAFDRFYMAVPYSQLLVMTTYYAAQFGITLSITDTKCPAMNSGTIRKKTVK